jgi:hypothetical protein
MTEYFARVPTGWYAVASCGMNDMFSQMEVGAVSRPLGRSPFAAAAGAVTGWLISADRDWATLASHRECAQSTGICFGIAVPAGLALGLTLTITAWAYSLTTAVALKLPGVVVWWPRRRRAL